MDKSTRRAVYDYLRSEGAATTTALSFALNGIDTEPVVAALRAEMRLGAHEHAWMMVDDVHGDQLWALLCPRCGENALDDGDHCPACVEELHEEMP